MKCFLLFLFAIATFTSVLGYEAYLNQEALLLNCEYLEGTATFVSDDSGVARDDRNMITVATGLPLTSSEFTIETWFFRQDSQTSTTLQDNPLFFLGNSSDYVVLTPISSDFAKAALTLFEGAGLHHKTSTPTPTPIDESLLADTPVTNPVGGSVRQRTICHVAVSVRTGTPSTFLSYCQDIVENGNRNYSGSGTLNIDLSHFESPNIYIGSFDGFTIGAINPLSFLGFVTEMRLWNVSRSDSEIINSRKVSFAGNEPNLLAYWRFDGDASDSTGNGFTGSPLYFDTQIGGNPHLYANAYRKISTFGTSSNRIPILSEVRRSIAFNEHSNIPISFRRPSACASSSTNGIVNTFPTVGVVSRGDGSSLTSGNIFDSCAAAPTPCEFVFRFTADRAACGKTATVLVQTEFVDSCETPTTSDIVNATFFVGSIDPSLTVQQYALPTTGGQITIQGSNFGRDDNLASDENVNLNFGVSNALCTAPEVSGNVIICTVGEGVGTANLEVNLCGQSTRTLSNGFRYQAPTLTSINGTSSSSITIVGSNFGPDRTSINTASNGVTINSQQCTISTIGHTQIECTVATFLENNSTNTYNITIGGQSITGTFFFRLCEFDCLNGGVCVGLNQCDCVGTGFTGDRCQSPLVCQPSCKNGGTCDLDIDSNTTFCECVDSFTGEDCSVAPSEGGSNSLPTGAIIGIAAGVGVVILVLVIVVIVLARRRGRREVGANFVPLEKKDFSKIIYGDQLNAHPEKNVGDLKALEDLLLKEDMQLVMELTKITQITEADKISKALIIVFQDSDKVIPLMKRFIKDEVTTTETAGTLFRSNSMVSKMFKYYSKLIGLPYLYITIGPEIDKLIEDELGLEVDPEKMEEGTDLDEMRWTLMAQSQKLLKQILDSTDKCPAQFKILLNYIKQETATKFPQNVNTTLGGFMFLRFFCPAVSSPEAYGIVEEPPSANSRRLLILITKVLQNLSNDVEFGSKEPYMTKMNDFVQANRPKLIPFYDKLTRAPTKPPVAVNMPKNMKPVNLAVIAAHIKQNIDKVENKDLKINS